MPNIQGFNTARWTRPNISPQSVAGRNCVVHLPAIPLQNVMNARYTALACPNKTNINRLELCEHMVSHKERAKSVCVGGTPQTYDSSVPVFLSYFFSSSLVTFFLSFFLSHSLKFFFFRIFSFLLA